MPFGILVNISSKELKSLGKWALKGRWGTAIGASLLSLLVVNIPPILFNLILGQDKWSNVVDAYTLLINGPMMLGLSMVFLNIFRKRETKPMEIFYGFEFLLKAVVLQIWMALLISLQTLCFVIPGLIATYRYSLAFFILADDPTKRPLQCITESKFLMHGNKMKMFQLTLSFMGWYFLAALPMALVLNYFPTTNWLVYELMILASGAIPCILEPYMQVTMAAFYEITNGSLRVKRTTPEYQNYDTAQNMNFNSQPEEPVQPEEPTEPEQIPEQTEASKADRTEEHRTGW
ncbi:MAG: DUF975 family protein [Firmicutes bacterium]|nr:DUF975 family protein [Bacillota bacterium]